MFIILDTSSARPLKRELNRLFSEVALMIPTPPTIITVSYRGSTITARGDGATRRHIASSKLQGLRIHADEIKSIAAKHAGVYVISSSHLVREYVTTGVYESVAHFARGALKIGYPDTDHIDDLRVLQYARICKRFDLTKYNLTQLGLVIPQDDLLSIVRAIPFENASGYRYNIALDQFSLL